jgi:hypothetical protein
MKKHSQAGRKHPGRKPREKGFRKGPGSFSKASDGMEEEPGAALRMEAVRLAGAPMQGAQQVSAAQYVGHGLGNARLNRLLVQRQEAAEAESKILKLDELLGRFNVPEEQVITLLGEMSDPEKNTVLNGGYRTKLAKALNVGEMVRAVTNLKAPLPVKLDWVKQAALFTSGIDYAEIKEMVKAAPQSEKDALKTGPWREVFVDICTNKTMLEAVNDLNFDLPTRTVWMVAEGLVEEKLAEYYLTLLPAQSLAVMQSLRALNGHDRDDVAYALVKAASDDQLKTLYADEAGKTLVTILLAEIAEGWTSGDEEKQRDRLLHFAPNDRPQAPDQSASEALKEKQASPAQALIDQYTAWGNLKEELLAKDLLKRLPGEWALVDKVLDTLDSHNQDDVSLALLDAARPDEIRTIAADANGRNLLLRMVHEMFLGDMSDDERKHMQRTMELITEVDRKQAGAKSTIEVVTFLFGGKVLDLLGTVAAGGGKGHTLVTVGNLVYSFELGWSCGRTREEYFEANKWRDAIGQELELSEEDARIVQDNLNASCGRGSYAVSGHICTDSAAVALEQVLGTLNAGWNPQKFVSTLESTGKVKARHFYPKQPEK